MGWGRVGGWGRKILAKCFEFTMASVQFHVFIYYASTGEYVIKICNNDISINIIRVINVFFPFFQTFLQNDLQNTFQDDI